MMNVVLHGMSTYYVGANTLTLGYYESFTFLSEKYDRHSWSDKPRNWRWFHKFRKLPPPWLPPLPVIQATCRHTVQERYPVQQRRRTKRRYFLETLR